MERGRADAAGQEPASPSPTIPVLLLCLDWEYTGKTGGP